MQEGICEQRAELRRQKIPHYRHLDADQDLKGFVHSEGFRSVQVMPLKEILKQVQDDDFVGFLGRR